jgi:hypothetical protein
VPVPRAARARAAHAHARPFPPLPRERYGWRPRFSPTLLWCVKTRSIDDSQYGPCNKSNTREWRPKRIQLMTASAAHVTNLTPRSGGNRSERQTLHRKRGRRRSRRYHAGAPRVSRSHHVRLEVRWGGGVRGRPAGRGGAPLPRRRGAVATPGTDTWHGVADDPLERRARHHRELAEHPGGLVGPRGTCHQHHLHVAFAFIYDGHLYGIKPLSQTESEKQSTDAILDTSLTSQAYISSHGDQSDHPRVWSDNPSTFRVKSPRGCATTTRRRCDASWRRS